MPSVPRDILFSKTIRQGAAWCCAHRYARRPISVKIGISSQPHEQGSTSAGPSTTTYAVIATAAAAGTDAASATKFVVTASGKWAATHQSCPPTAASAAAAASATSASPHQATAGVIDTTWHNMCPQHLLLLLLLFLCYPVYQGVCYINYLPFSTNNRKCAGRYRVSCSSMGCQFLISHDTVYAWHWSQATYINLVCPSSGSASSTGSATAAVSPAATAAAGATAATGPDVVSACATAGCLSGGCSCCTAGVLPSGALYER